VSRKRIAGRRTKKGGGCTRLVCVRALFSGLQVTKTEEDHVDTDDDILAGFWSTLPVIEVA